MRSIIHSAPALRQDSQKGAWRVHHGVSYLGHGCIGRGRLINCDRLTLQVIFVRVKVERRRHSRKVVSWRAGESYEWIGPIVNGYLATSVDDTVVLECDKRKYVTQVRIRELQEALGDRVHLIVIDANGASDRPADCAIDLDRISKWSKVGGTRKNVVGKVDGKIACKRKYCID